MQPTFPRIKAVAPLPNKRLYVTFDDDTVKVYDCSRLLDDEPFRLLRDEAFFRSVRVEPGGYAVIWSDQVDLAESELWTHGEQPDHSQRAESEAATADTPTP